MTELEELDVKAWWFIWSIDFAVACTLACRYPTAEERAVHQARFNEILVDTMNQFGLGN